MILVTTPTGKTGSLITEELIKLGSPIRVFARHPKSLSEIVKNAADVVCGSLLIQEELNHAMKGCEAVYYCVPETHIENDIIDRYSNFATIAANAVKYSGVKRIVFLSGRGKSKNRYGAITRALHKAEEILTESGASMKALRCPVFFESLLYQLESIKQSGMFFMPFDGNFKAPQVSVKDIAREAVKWLTDAHSVGNSSVDIQSDIVSYNEIAAILSDVVAKPVRFVNIPKSKYMETMLGIGAAPKFAEALTDMYDEIQNGLFNPDQETPVVDTQTGFRRWAQTVFLQAYNNQ